MANHEDLIEQILDQIKDGNPSSVSDALNGFQKYPMSGSKEDLLVKELEHELIERNLVQVTRPGGTNSTIHGYAHFVISVLGQQYLKNRKDPIIQPNGIIIHALSLSSSDESLSAEGLRNAGLVGYILTTQIPRSVALNWIRITFNKSKQDNLYTTNREKEKISKRNPIDKGILGFVYDHEEYKTVRLRRIFNKNTLDRVYLTSFLSFSDESTYSDESNEHPMFLLREKVANTAPLYLYSNVPHKFQQAIEEDRINFSTNEDVDYSKEERIKELKSEISKKGVDRTIFSFPRLEENNITVTVVDGVQNFYIQLQESKDFFTVRINPAKPNGEYIFNDVDSWKKVLEHFNEWLDSFVDPGGIATTIISMNNAEGVRFLEGATSFSIRNEQIKSALNVEVLANIFFRLIDSIPPSENGLLLGIFGKWGRGKTYFWQNLKKAFEERNKAAKISSKEQKEKPTTVYEHVEFHAWKYQDTHASWAYLYEVCIKQYYKKPLRIALTQKIISWEWLTRIINRFYLNVSRVGYFSLILGGITLVYGVVWYFFLDFKFKWNLLSYLFTFIGLGPLISGLMYYYFYSGTAKKLIKQYFSEPTYQDLLGIQAEIQKELCTLFGVWIPHKQLTSKRIVLFVDDIDRCNEDRIIQVIDSLKVMMDEPFISKRVVVIAAIDETVLMRAIKLKYHEMVNNDQSLKEDEKTETLEQLCREYMDKLFLNGFKLGSLSSNDKIDIVKSITEDRIFFRNEDRKEDKFKKPSETKDDEAPVTSTGSNSDITTETKEPNPTKLVESTVIKTVSDPKKFITMLPKEDFEIMDYELVYILNAVTSLKNTTPRTIRIIYYRYLLAKHFKEIFIPKDSEIYNEWIVYDQKEILSFMIVDFTNHNKQRHLTEEMTGTTTDQSTPKTHIFLGKEFILSQELYLALLKIVEIVVPY